MTTYHTLPDNNKKRKMSLKSKILIGTVFSIIGVGLLAPKTDRDQSVSQTKTPKETQTLYEIEQARKLKEPDNIAQPSINMISPSREGFDTVIIADIEITNHFDYEIKDVEIRCDGYTRTGTKVDSNTFTIYDYVYAARTGYNFRRLGYKQFPKVNIGFVHSAAVNFHCHITGFEKA